MTTIKSFTDIDQSKRLAEILPIESADMYYCKEGGLPHWKPVYETDYFTLRDTDIPCWSLAVLLEALDDEITNEDGNDYNLTIIKEDLQYQLYYHDSWGRAEDIETDYYDDMVDACYEMILKLNELNLL